MIKEQAVKDFFSIFQEGYTKRDVEFLDRFMDSIFEEDIPISVMGTGNNEIYSTKEEVRDLFEGDWLYWGDLKVKIDTLVEQSIGTHDVFVVKGDLTMSFEDNDQTVPRYHNFVKDIIDEATSDVNHMKHQHMKAQFVLDHFLHKRDTVKRKNNYPIVMVFLCEEVEGEYKVRALTFNNPPEGLYPDERLHQFTGYEKDYEKSVLHLHEIGKSLSLPSVFSMKKSSDFMFVDVNGKTYKQVDGLKQLDKRLCEFKEVILNEEVGLLYEQNDVMACSYIGRVVKVINEEESRRNLHQRILKTLSSDKDLKDQLFIIRREMSILNKEQSLGHIHDWPCRVFAVMKKVDGETVLHMLQFGYPMDMILEDKHL